MRLLLFFVGINTYAMHVDMHDSPLSRTPNPPDLALPVSPADSHLDVYEQIITTHIRHSSGGTIDHDSICEAVYQAYFRGNGDKLRPSVMPHLKKQIAHTVESDAEKKVELLRIAKEIKLMKEKQSQSTYDLNDASSSGTSILTPAIQDMVADAVTLAIEEKDRNAQIYERNARVAERKYKLENKKLNVAILAHVLTFGCTAVVSSAITAAVALIIHFTA